MFVGGSLRAVTVRDVGPARTTVQAGLALVAAFLGVSLAQLPLPPRRSQHSADSVGAAQLLLADLQPPVLPPLPAAPPAADGIIMPGVVGAAGMLPVSQLPPLTCVLFRSQPACSQHLDLDLA